jgi:transposase
MNRRDQLLQQAQREPEHLVEQLIDLETRLAEQAQRIAEQNSLIEQLKRMLFGPKSEKLTQEQAEQLAEVVQDLQEQAEHPASDSDEVLEAEEEDAPKQKKKRGGRHPLPVHLEVQTTVLEPEQANCEHCGQLGEEIGRDTSEQVDLIPAKLILRRTRAVCLKSNPL